MANSCSARRDRSREEDRSMDARTIGVLGGGQLGRMIAQAAHRLGIRVAVLDPGQWLTHLFAMQ
jgi:phosphoglycerate dehydrogenase-like enzyme